MYFRLSVSLRRTGAVKERANTTTNLPQTWHQPTRLRP